MIWCKVFREKLNKALIDLSRELVFIYVISFINSLYLILLICIKHSRWQLLNFSHVKPNTPKECKYVMEVIYMRIRFDLKSNSTLLSKNSRYCVMYFYISYGLQNPVRHSRSLHIYSITPSSIFKEVVRWQCLVPLKFQKFYKILRYIKSLNAYMKH
jgi:hypothetical protein